MRDVGDDAFAATIAPASSGGPTPPNELATGTQASIGGGDIPSDLPALPLVPDGHFTQEKEIARGGMGRIVSAKDERLHRQVAIKELLEPAGEQLTRFQREALITARLQHPGIVPVYEAGRWPSGEPFFAMKLVSGRPLDRVIHDARTFEERLALLPRIAAAADAIAYAHSHRVVHRDLKPGNILIGDFGETVVIDWGLAKDLEAGDSVDTTNRVPRPKARADSNAPTLTVAGAVMGTPAYMAPEQARGERVDERSDVFALGAMLYHLLAGVPPYNARTATDVIAAAALGKVVPLREREEGAPDDLVTIVERAMAQLPGDRYANAGELAEELKRFLTGQLVIAHRYTRVQRIARFVKKHRAAVTIAAIATLAMTAGGAFAVHNVVEARDRAEREALVATARQQAAEKLIDAMLDDMQQRLVAIGRIDLLASLGGEVREYYDTLATLRSGIPLEDIDRMAMAIDLVGRAERDSGQSDRALKTWTDGRAFVENALAATAPRGPSTIFKRAMLARLDHQIGTVHQTRGKSALAVAAYVKAKEQFAALRTEAPTNVDVLRWAADNHDRLGDILRNDGKIDEAFDEYTAAKTDRERASSQPSSQPSLEVRALATSHLKLGSIHQVRGDSTTALAAYRKALRLTETVLENQPDHVDVLWEAIHIQDVTAELQRQIGDTASAIETYNRAIPLITSLVQRDGQNVHWQRKRGALHADLGFALLDSGDFKGGLAQLETATDVQKALAARDPKSSMYQIDLSRSYMRAGDGYLYLGAVEDGIAQYQQSLEIRKKLSDKDPKSAAYRRATAWSLHKLANAYTMKGDDARAIAMHEDALALRKRLADEAPAQTGFKNELASTEIALGRLVSKTDPKRGKELTAAGLERARALFATDAASNEWKETLTQGLLAQAQCAQIDGNTQMRRTSYDEALTHATAARTRAPQNPQWPGFLAEIHAGYAELATRDADRRAAWRAVRDLLEPLEKENRLPAVRKNLLERARANR